MVKHYNKFVKSDFNKRTRKKLSPIEWINLLNDKAYEILKFRKIKIKSGHFNPKYL